VTKKNGNWPITGNVAQIQCLELPAKTSCVLTFFTRIAAFNIFCFEHLEAMLIQALLLSKPVTTPSN